MVRWLVVFALLIVTGCASYPEQVKVPEGTELISYNMVNSFDSNYLGKQARWSGVIADVSNLAKTTRLEILFYPAAENGRPNTKAEPLGRFRTYSNKFLDPAIYKKGKSVTALGVIAPKQTAKIDQYEYEYPTLTDVTVYLWPKKPKMTQVHFQYGWYGYHPRWYWQGGVRHLYIIGQDRKQPYTKKAKPSEK